MENTSIDSKGYGIETVTKVERTGESRRIEKYLLVEQALAVYINGKLAMKVVCTPQDIKEMVIGHLYSEGVISDYSQVNEVIFCENKKEVRVQIVGNYKGIPFEMNSCNTGPTGILGRNTTLPEGKKNISEFSWEPQWLFTLGEAFEQVAPLYEKTTAIHSCMLMHEGEIIYRCEDIGRHNALDKAVGSALLKGLPLSQCILFSSGRIPLDMIKKAIRAGAGMLASKTMPTKEAVVLAKDYGITLIGKVRKDSFEIYSNSEKMVSL